MTRTKWMRLGVSDPADILRWAGAQNTRQLDDFRHRVIRGREFVSFRMVPRYPIEIGTSDIVVVAHVKDTTRQRLVGLVAVLRRKAARQVSAAIATLTLPVIAPGSVPTAELYQLAALRVSSRSHR
jgi:hypothetical protein